MGRRRTEADLLIHLRDRCVRYDDPDRDARIATMITLAKENIGAAKDMTNRGWPRPGLEMLEGALVYMGEAATYAMGYRVPENGAGGYHQNAVEALCIYVEAYRPDIAPYSVGFQQIRRRRNETKYQASELLSASEVGGYLAAVEAFYAGYASDPEARLLATRRH
jgi:hypothetical protein